MEVHHLPCKAGWLIKPEEEGKLQVQLLSLPSLQEAGSGAEWI